MINNFSDSLQSPKADTSTSIGRKVYGLIGFCLGLLVLVVGSSIYQMGQIGGEIEGIAERDLPLTEALTQITIHQLEQAINVERAFRTGVEMNKHPEAKAEYEKAVGLFKSLGKKVEKEFHAAEKISKIARDTSHTKEEIHEFSSVLKRLKALDELHGDYDYKVRKAFKRMGAGKVARALKLLPKIEAEEEKLDHGLENILIEVEKFTSNAALTAEKHEHFSLKLMIVTTIIALISGVVLSYYLVRGSIIRPLREIVTGLDALNRNDFSVDVKVYNNDEIGAVAKAYAMFKESALQKQRDEAQKQAERRQENAQRDAMTTFTQDFSAKIGGIVETVSSASAELNVTAQSMSSSSEQTSQQVSQASMASEQTSNNVQSVATATEEMTSTISEIAQQVAQASGASQQAVTEVGNTSEQMSALAQTANKIGEVVELISGIAEQTNLLALNATIESARAGEAGKGFAVVAGEVKQLASQTAKATSEISEQINDIQNATKRASGSMDSVADAINRVDEISTAIAAAMEEQSAATQEIATSVNQAAVGTQQVNDNISSVSEASREAGTASGQVMSAAGQLSEQAALLKSEVNNFIEKVQVG